MILEDLDGNNIAGPLLPALDHLTEGASTEKLENLKKWRND
jgi:hypothetical protein